jgi:outer membrane protein
MKKLFKVALIAVGIMFTGSFAKAQTKIGHISMEEVAALMPELKTVQTQMQAYQKDWQDQLQKNGEELNKKIKEYQDGEKTMTDAVKATRQADLQDMQKRYQDFQAKAEQEVQTKYAELTKPVIEKIRTAITAVAKEKGYGYVFNSSQTELLVAPDADNLLAAVKIKLGLK